VFLGNLLVNYGNSVAARVGHVDLVRCGVYCYRDWAHRIGVCHSDYRVCGTVNDAYIVALAVHDIDLISRGVDCDRRIHGDGVKCLCVRVDDVRGRVGCSVDHSDATDVRAVLSNISKVGHIDLVSSRIHCDCNRSEALESLIGAVASVVPSMTVTVWLVPTANSEKLAT